MHEPLELGTVGTLRVVASLAAYGTLAVVGSALLSRSVRYAALQIYSVRDYGAKGDGVADDTVKVQAAESAAEQNPGSTVYYPRPPVAYRLTASINVAASVRHFGDGWGTVIRQDAPFLSALPVFEVRGASDVTIEGLKLQCGQSRVDVGAQPCFYGQAARQHSAGVYAAISSRVKTRNVWVDGFCCGVSLRGNTDNVTLDVDNQIEDCRFTNCDFDILPLGQKRLRTAHCFGTYSPSQGVASHFIYFTSPNGTLYSEDCTCDDLVAHDSPDSFAYQFKFVRNSVCTGLHASATAGLFGSFQNVEDCMFSGFSGTGMVPSAATASIYIPATSTVRRNTFASGRVDTNVDSVAAIGVGANNDDNTFRDIDVFVTFTSGSASGAVVINGNRNRMIDLRVEMLSANKPGIQLQGAAVDCEVINPMTKSCSTAVEVSAAGATRTVIEIDPDLQLSSGTNIADAGTGTLVKLAPSIKTLTYGATINTDASMATLFQIVATNGTAFTIANPTSGAPNPPSKGMQLTYDIKNSSGGAMGAITWGAAFLLAGAFTNPANGKRRTITFYYDGANWVEINRAAADI